MNKYLLICYLITFSPALAMEDRQIVRSSGVKSSEVMNDVEFILNILRVIQDKIKENPQDIALGCGTIKGINVAKQKALKLLAFLKELEKKPN